MTNMQSIIPVLAPLFEPSSVHGNEPEGKVELLHTPFSITT